MSKKLIIATVVVFVLLAVGYWYWKNTALTPEEQALQRAEESTKVLTESSARGVLPTLNVQENPVNNLPDANPVNKTNPFSGVKTNPFQ